MLPFLKKAQEGSASAPIETIEREHDDTFDMLGTIADDILSAVESKDKEALKGALSALCEHLKDMDEQQDNELMEGKS